MRRIILVPTDFSNCAVHASDLAVELAPLFNAEVHLLHRVYTPPFWAEYTDKERDGYPETQARLARMEELFGKLKKRYKDKFVKIEANYSSGDLIPTVARYIDEEDVYMIIMGSAGASGYKEFTFGSNAQKIVRHAHCPALVVKGPVRNPNFRNIVFASDFRDEAIKPFERMVDFGRRFGAHIHLLHIAAYPRFEVTEKDVTRMKEFAKDCPLPYTIHGVGDFEVKSGIEFFAKKVKADLVSIAHYGKGPIKRMLMGSVTESLVNHLEVPVLALNTKEVRHDEILEQSAEREKDPATNPAVWSPLRVDG